MKSPVSLFLLGSAAVGALGAALRRRGRDVPPDAASIADVGAASYAATGGASVATHGSAETLVAERALWDGSDSVPQWYLAGHLTNATAGVTALNAVTSNTTGRYSKIQIAGLFDSGTNLMRATLALNFPNFASQCPENSCWWWKHSVPATNEALLQDTTLLIQMVRSPIAHMASWTKAPYDLESCVDHYELPCNIRGTAFPGGVTDVWNHYTSGYDRFAGARDNVIVVQYENLVLEPEKVVTRIANLLGVTLQGSVEIVGGPAKDHGDPVGRAEAMAKINGMSYLQDFHLPAAPESLCDRLSPGLMSRHVIPTEPPRTYAADCSE